MIKVQNKKMISVSDWDDLVVKTYGRPYSFQQQDGCQARGTFHLSVPDSDEDYENDTVPEEVNGDEMGVSFAAWLAARPIQTRSLEPRIPVRATNSLLLSIPTEC